MIPTTLRAIIDGALVFIASLPIRPQIRVLSGRCGLFSDVLVALNAIERCEELGLSGSVHWGRRSLYFDPAIGGNAYEYFFSNSGFGKSRRNSHSFFLPYVPAGDTYSGSGLPNSTPRQHLKQLIDRFARPREEILGEVQTFMNQHLHGARILGVHVRRTDAVRGWEDRRVQPVSNFVNAAERWISGHPDWLVFLATDADDVVADFKGRLGSRVVVQNALRSEDGRSLHGHHDEGTHGSPSRKGKEALIDALILSRCDFLIRCFSFLTAYSLCFNQSLPFLDLDKLNLGVVRTRWLHE